MTIFFNGFIFFKPDIYCKCVVNFFLALLQKFIGKEIFPTIKFVTFYFDVNSKLLNVELFENLATVTSFLTQDYWGKQLNSEIFIDL